MVMVSATMARRWAGAVVVVLAMVYVLYSIVHSGAARQHMSAQLQKLAPADADDVLQTEEWAPDMQVPMSAPE